MKLDPKAIVALEQLSMTLSFGVTCEKVRLCAPHLKNVEKFLLALNVELAEEEAVRTRQILSFVSMVLSVRNGSDLRFKESKICRDLM